MIDGLLYPAKQMFTLKEVDIGEYACIKGSGMKFNVRVFDAENAGRLFLMDMKAMFGLMKMETAVFSPVQLDGPILSADVVLALGRSTLVLELYDTTASHPDFSALDDIKKKYATLPSYDPGDHPYYRMRLEQSAYKQGRRIKDAVEAMADAYGKTYFDILKKCDVTDPCEKKKRNAEFTNCLIESGGPAVNQFKKMIGVEKTREFLMKYMFCSE